jgi:hypothetical protein
MQTEFEFVLPKGFVDRAGNLHRKGTMRLATALDEITPLRDPRVRQNPAYHTVVLLARVITKLGTMPSIDTSVIEGMFTADLAFLQDFYRQKNELDVDAGGAVRCPGCGETFQAEAPLEEEPMPLPEAAPFAAREAGPGGEANPFVERALAAAGLPTRTN